MKRIKTCLLLLGLISTMVAPTTAQSLSELKTVLESHFSGTELRGVTKEFGLVRARNDYTLTGNLHELLDTMRLNQLAVCLEQYNAPDTSRYTGTIYFDRYTDSAFVDIRLADGYTFHALPAMPVPAGGMEAFSKRFHYFLNEQLAEGVLDTNALADFKETRFGLERDGSLLTLDSGAVGDVIKAFLRTERKWTPGISSGRPVITQVTLNLIPDFVLADHVWPSDHEWASFAWLTYFEIAKPLTYYTLDKAQIRPGHTAISVVWDPMSKLFRAPFVHSGTPDDAMQIIQDLTSATERRRPTIHYPHQPRRVYFYRESQ